MKTEYKNEITVQRPIEVSPNFGSGILRVVNKSKNNRYSWFLTDESGHIHLSGCESKNEAIIKIDNIDNGIYRFRAQGEVYVINKGIAS